MRAPILPGERFLRSEYDGDPTSTLALLKVPSDERDSEPVRQGQVDGIRSSKESLSGHPRAELRQLRVGGHDPRCR